jgi:transcriptional regulator with XRE-family HTH domain
MTTTKPLLKYGDKTKIANQFGVTIQYVIAIEKGKSPINTPTAKQIEAALKFLKNGYLRLDQKIKELETITVGDLDDDGVDEGCYAD